MLQNVPSMRSRKAKLPEIEATSQRRDQEKPPTALTPVWRANMANDLRRLRTENEPISKDRAVYLEQRFPTVTELPTRPARTNRYVALPRQWAPVVNSAAILPLGVLFFKWTARFAMEQSLALIAGQTAAQAVANQVLQYSAASFAAEAFVIINAPLVSWWRDVSVQNAYNRAIELTVRDERIWAIQEDRRQRAATLSYGANKTVGDATEYVNRMVDNSFAVLALVLSTSLSRAGFGPVGIAAPLAGLVLYGLSQRFIQKSLREEELVAEDRYNVTNSALNDHLQINNTYNWALWQQSANTASRDVKRARFRHAVAKTSTELAVAGVNITGIMARRWSTIRTSPDASLNTKFLDETARSVRKTAEVSHRVTDLSKGLGAYSDHADRLGAIDNAFCSAPRQEWRARSLNMLNRIDDIHLATKNVSPAPVNESETEKGSTSRKELTVADLMNNPRAHLGEGKHGRFTITGDNGAGKSTFMNYLASQLGAEKHYINTDSMLQYASEGGSAGEKTLNQLAESIERIVDKPVYLLDEWPANLSTSNIRRVNDLLNALSERVCVVEIVHCQLE